MKSSHLNGLWVNWEELVQITANRRIVFFGRGEWVDKTLPYLGHEADYIVDNNEYEQGHVEHGLKIFNPQVLKEEDWDDLIVIITTTGFQEVEAQLVGFGLIPGRHFIVSPSLKNFHSIHRINQHDCDLLLTSSDRPNSDPMKGGGLYSYNLQSRTLEKIISGVCHGIVAGDDCLYLVDDLAGVRVLNNDLTVDSCFSLPEKSRPHGIAYCQDEGKIFVNFAGRDAIGVYDAKSQEKLDEVFISDKWRKSGVPQHHLNDMCVHGGSLFVSMFSLSGNWKRGVYDGGILEFDTNNMKQVGRVVENLWMPHSPVFLNGSLCYCDSMRGTVHNTTWKTITGFNGFVRGIAHDGVFYYVGQSMHRYIDRLEHASNNISLDSGIFIVDEHNKTTKFFSIPQLTDIKALLLLEQ